MKLKFLFFILIITCYACNNAPQKNVQLPLLLPQLNELVKENHLQGKPINDDFSERMFNLFLEKLDPEKALLTQEQLAALNRYKQGLDDEINTSSFVFFEEVIPLINQRINTVEKYTKDILKQTFDFSKIETLETDFDKLTYVNNDAELKERWRKKIKKYLLEALVKGEVQASNFSFELQQKEAKKQVEKLLANKIKSYQKIDGQKRLEQYVKSYLTIHDVQTAYMSPEKSDAWHASYTRSTAGIGVALEIVGAYPQVTELTIGGPAWKTEQLAVGDVLVKATNKNKELVDMAGMEMSEVVLLLKGEKGTVASLVVKKENEEIKTINIKRDKIDFDLASSFLLVMEGEDEKVGYIKLPRFYTGDEGASSHILKEIRLLNKNNVKGLVLDLRNNKGGSSAEVAEMMGYFLEGGVVMQAKSNNGTMRIREDADKSAQYHGKMVVLVNAKSGSASEVFAGTMQDYGRALIVGQQTVGKGSVQRFYTLETAVTEQGDSIDLGQVKLTTARFFTASGRSPQYKGISPDIVLPNEDAFITTGERRFEYALAPEDLPNVKKLAAQNAPTNLLAIKQQSKERMADNKCFQLTTKKAKRIKEKKENTRVQLNYEQYQNAQLENKKEEALFEEIFNPINQLEVTILAPEDTAVMLRKEALKKDLEKDPYLQECYWIIQDLIG